MITCTMLNVRHAKGESLTFIVNRHSLRKLLNVGIGLYSLEARLPHFHINVRSIPCPFHQVVAN